MKVPFENESKNVKIYNDVSKNSNIFENNYQNLNTSDILLNNSNIGSNNLSIHSNHILSDEFLKKSNDNANITLSDN